VTEKFPGWSNFNGMIEHIKFVKSHHRKIAKVALVTDSKIADVAESLGKHFVKALASYLLFIFQNLYNQSFQHVSWILGTLDNAPV